GPPIRSPFPKIRFQMMGRLAVAGTIAYSIIIPAYNSERSIVACLDAVIGQIDRSGTEIIVVDSGQDATASLVRENFPQVKFFHSKQRLSAGEARNKGIKEACGGLVLFIDSDCVAEPGWFSGMIRLHEKYDCAAVGGGVLNGNPESLASWAGYFLEFSRFLPTRGQGRFVTHQPTCNISYKRRIFEQYGDFPADLYPVEDRVFNQRFILQGERIFFDPRIRVKHFHRATPAGLMRHQWRIGWGSARMRKLETFKKSRILVNPFLLPFTATAMVGMRFLVLLRRLVFSKPDLLLPWLMSLPLYLPGVIVWVTGFAKEACKKTPST
ncbi:MAG: glycosyltransferase, partial [Planctomycetes bacterium]|nr:glycosyltransferase [Planctomycetota bacterium]